MPSPATDPDNPGALIGTAAARRNAVASPRVRRFRRILLGLGAVGLLVPVIAGLISAATSPPHIKGVPLGHLIYLSPDEPSEHTTFLRGLRIADSAGHSREIIHEFEAQDADTGEREWFGQPKASPNGRYIAYERQVFTILDEKQTTENQIDVIDLSMSDPKPRLLIDLSAEKLKQVVGLAWTVDGAYVAFLEDTQIRYVPVAPNARPRPADPLPLLLDQPKVSSEISAARSLALAPGASAYLEVTARGQWLCASRGEQSLEFRNVRAYALASDGSQLAYVPGGSGHALVVAQWNGSTRTVPVRWGWSLFGRREITAVSWSPDGRFLAYSVSKPPIEDELFCVRLSDGEVFQLPVRAGRAAWDWGR